ncbi:unnamed protein product [Effrenium voratum]|nr:unnamed protein product [Effrenium voratum]
MSLTWRPQMLQSVIGSTVHGPQTHRLPWKVMWGITLLTSLGVALMNFGMILVIQFLVRLKFHSMQLAMAQGGALIGILALMGVSTAYALCGVCLIQLCAPACGGSGIPENKAFLNGGAMPNLYSRRTLGVRACTNVLANAAGFPVGREGPMVTMGSNLAFLLCERLIEPLVREWVRVEGHRGELVDEHRLAHSTRISCASVLTALETGAEYIPVRDGLGPCLGICTRRALRNLLGAREVAHHEGEQVFLDTELTQSLPIHRVMDPTPFTVTEDMPAPRLYALFAKAGEVAACVTSLRGEFRGILSRDQLIEAVQRG